MKNTNETVKIIKDKLLRLIDDETGSIRTKYFVLEKLISVMLDDYLNNQGRSLIINDKISMCDFFVEEGFDDFEGNTLIDIKWAKNSYGFYGRALYDTVGRVALSRPNIDNLLIIMIGEVSQSYKQKLFEEQKNTAFNIHIWDINDLVKIFSKNEKLFLETYDNVNKNYINQTINKALDRNKNQYIEKRNRYIDELNTAYNKDDLVLFLGAGVSSDAKIATWDMLISTLFVSLINNKLTENGITISESNRKKLVTEIKNQNNNSPLLQTRFLKQGIENFEESVRQTLYNDAKETSEEIESIAQLCVPKRGKVGIKAIINYNFDDLIERNLKRINLKYKSIFSEGMIPDADEIGIFHVHGFLPKESTEYKDLANSLLVFSEEGYHKLMLEPYNWANITQLNFLMNNTCLFLGLSMTDPNLRRLLDISAQKNIENECKHYVILKRLKLYDNDVNLEKFEHINEELQESFYKELGVNIIWIDSYDEIPNILDRIKQ